MTTIYTIGHSNHEPDMFLQLLQQAQIDVLIDVRSNPNSTWAPFANRDNLKNLLNSAGIKYVYMGDTLGGQPSDQESYNHQTGKVDYAVVQERASFKQSITKLLSESKKYKICLMCAEENPIHCHRSLLVSSALTQSGAKILHIRGDKRIQTDEEISKERARVPLNQQRLPL